MKILEIGDVHVKKDNIEESERLVNWISDVAKSTKADLTVFLGDQYNDFGVVSTDVLEFWRKHFGNFTKRDKALNGNHDENAPGITSAMSAHEDQITVVFDEVLIEDDVAYVGFIRDNDKFIEVVNKLPLTVKYCYCHAEFDGAQFESGFYTQHGIDLTKLPQHIQFRSGHIHRRMQYGNVRYVGTPRMLKKTDISTEKGITLFDTVTGQEVFIPTPKEVCEPFQKIVITTPEELAHFKKQKFTSKVYVEVVGDVEFIKASVKALPDELSIRGIPTTERKITGIKESEGINVAFVKYIQEYCTTSGLDPALKIAVAKSIMGYTPFLRN